MDLITKQSVLSFYAASRASSTARPLMWRQWRDEQGVKIVSSWIDAILSKEPTNLSELWTNIVKEIASCNCLVLYVSTEDLPLKGAFVEVGMALALGKPIRIVAPDIGCTAEALLPVLGSWVAHPAVTICQNLKQAFAKST